MASYIASILSLLCSLHQATAALDLRSSISVDDTPQELLQKWGLQKQFGKAVNENEIPHVTVSLAFCVTASNNRFGV